MVEGIMKIFIIKGVEFFVVYDVSLVVCLGEFFVIVGLSGCGKLMLLQIIVGLMLLIVGKVLFGVEDVIGELVYMVYFFQQYSKLLLFWQMVEQNVMFFFSYCMYLLCVVNCECCFEYLGMVGLVDFGCYYFWQFFGGMQQCVVIVCVLVVELWVLLLDELFLLVDVFIWFDLYVLIQDLWVQKGFIVVLVIYDVDEVVFFVDCIVVMSCWLGVICEIVEIWMLCLCIFMEMYVDSWFQVVCYQLFSYLLYKLDMIDVLFCQCFVGDCVYFGFVVLVGGGGVLGVG